MDQEYFIGLMEGSILANIKMIKNKVTVHLNGQMGKNTLDNGLMESNKEMEYLKMQIVKKKRDCGKVVKE